MKISEQIFYRSKGINRYTESHQFTWGEICYMLEQANIKLQSDDTLTIEYQEGYQEEDSAMDPCYVVTVDRWREETPGEMERRKRALLEHRSRQEKLDYEQYLELKKRFDDRRTDILP